MVLVALRCVGRFLIDRCIQTLSLANFFYWYVAVERRDKQKGAMFSSLGAHFLDALSKVTHPLTLPLPLPLPLLRPAPPSTPITTSAFPLLVRTVTNFGCCAVLWCGVVCCGGAAISLRGARIGCTR